MPVWVKQFAYAHLRIHWRPERPRSTQRRFLKQFIHFLLQLLAPVNQVQRCFHTTVDVTVVPQHINQFRDEITFR